MKSRLNGSIEIDQDLTWFGALAGTQNTALLQNINDPRRTRITESQPALEQRSGRAFFLSNNLDTFFNQFFIFGGDFFLWRASGLEFLMHGGIKCRRALFRNKFNDRVNLVISDEHALCTDEPRSARRQIKHVALPEQTVGAVLIKNDAAVDLARDLERDAAWNIRFDNPSDHVRARCLRCD